MANSRVYRATAAYVMLVSVSAYAFLQIADANGFTREETFVTGVPTLVLLVGVGLYFLPRR
jgi:hypothetical protein